MPDRQGSEREFPEWLKTIAVRVDELVSEPAARNRFHTMLRQWADAHGQSRRRVFSVPPLRAMTLPEKYAVLAAIHDGICEDAKEISPWGYKRQIKNPARLEASIPYAAFVDHCVSQITDEHRERLEGVLAEVTSDLQALSIEPQRTTLPVRHVGLPRLGETTTSDIADSIDRSDVDDATGAGRGMSASQPITSPRGRKPSPKGKRFRPPKPLQPAVEASREEVVENAIRNMIASGEKVTSNEVAKKTHFPEGTIRSLEVWKKREELEKEHARLGKTYEQRGSFSQKHTPLDELTAREESGDL